VSVEPILTGRSLVKRYGRVTALDHADFDLYPNEILAVSLCTLFDGTFRHSGHGY
jgi:ABC-type phosphonate transport system ATPase subunit